jgi:hypothetical protein
LRNALVVVVLVAALGVALVWHYLQAQAVLATSFGARIACSCHYIGGRGLADCRKDFEPGMGLVMLSDDAQTRTITARVPLIARQTASFREGPGCLLQGWAP